MRILYGITKSNFGGAQRYVLELAVEARKRGHDVAVVCGGVGPLVDKLHNEDIRIISLPHMGKDISTLDDSKSFFFLLGILGKFKPDVFHTNSSKMGGIGGVAGRIMGVPKIIFTAHGWAFNEERPKLQRVIIKFFSWLTVLLSHKTICVSEKTMADISKMPFAGRKLVLIRNGVEPFNLSSRKDARDKFALGIPEDVTIVGAISELHKTKGLDILLEAWHKFSQRHNARLVIIGAGEEEGALTKLASTLGIADSVIFKGFIDHARFLLSGFDIFLMPSRSEGLPYSLLEAGVAGLPVIAAEVGGIPEIIENGTNGILVSKENSELIYSSLVLLEENKDLRKRLGRAIESTIKSKFSIKEMLEKTFGLYSS